MSTPSHAVESGAFARIPSAHRADHEFLYAIVAIAFLFLVLAAVALGTRQTPLAGEEGADAIALNPTVVD